MKITLDTAVLSRELYKLQGIVTSKSTAPMVQNALLEAGTDGWLTLRATDFDISLSTRIPCIVETPGKAAIRGRDLYDAVKNLRAEQLSLEREENGWVQLRAGSVKARLVGANPEEFPQIPSGSSANQVPVETKRLLRMFDRVIFAISTDESRPNLCGARTVVTPGLLQMASTDGHRLSMVETRVDTSGCEVPDRLRDGVILPRKGIAELRRTIEGSGEVVQFALSDNHAVFRYGDTTMTVRLVDGSFPNFAQVVPVEREERKARVARATLVDRIKYVSLFAHSRTHNVRLALEDGVCTISAQDPDKGECQEDVEVTYSGVPARAGYNYRYLLDVLNVLGSEQITLEMIDEKSPTILHELDGDEGEKSLFIVMPMRL